MRYSAHCPHCGKYIRLRGNLSTAEQLRQARGDFIDLRCHRCGQEVKVPYAWVWAEGWDRLARCCCCRSWCCLALARQP